MKNKIQMTKMTDEDFLKKWWKETKKEWAEHYKQLSKEDLINEAINWRYNYFIIKMENVELYREIKELEK